MGLGELVYDPLGEFVLLCGYCDVITLGLEVKLGYVVEFEVIGNNKRTLISQYLIIHYPVLLPLLREYIIIHRLPKPPIIRYHKQVNQYHIRQPQLVNQSREVHITKYSHYNVNRMWVLFLLRTDELEKVVTAGGIGDGEEDNLDGFGE